MKTQNQKKFNVYSKKLGQFTDQPAPMSSKSLKSENWITQEKKTPFTSSRLFSASFPKSKSVVLPKHTLNASPPPNPPSSSPLKERSSSPTKKIPLLHDQQQQQQQGEEEINMGVIPSRPVSLSPTKFSRTACHPSTCQACMRKNHACSKHNHSVSKYPEIKDTTDDATFIELSFVAEVIPPFELGNVEKRETGEASDANESVLASEDLEIEVQLVVEDVLVKLEQILDASPPANEEESKQLDGLATLSDIPTTPVHTTTVSPQSEEPLSILLQEETQSFGSEEFSSLNEGDFGNDSVLSREPVSMNLTQVFLDEEEEEMKFEDNRHAWLMSEVHRLQAKLNVLAEQAAANHQVNTRNKLDEDHVRKNLQPLKRALKQEQIDLAKKYYALKEKCQRDQEEWENARLLEVKVVQEQIMPLLEKATEAPAPKKFSNGKSSSRRFKSFLGCGSRTSLVTLPLLQNSTRMQDMIALVSMHENFIRNAEDELTFERRVFAALQDALLAQHSNKNEEMAKFLFANSILMSEECERAALREKQNLTLFENSILSLHCEEEVVNKTKVSLIQEEQV